MKLGDKVNVTSCSRFSFFRSPCSTRESNLPFFASDNLTELMAIILEAFYMRAIFELQPNCSSRRETNYRNFEDTRARTRKGEEASSSLALRVLPPFDPLRAPKNSLGTLRSEDGDGRQNAAEKENFAFFQSSSQLLQVTNFVKCRRTLQNLNS